MDRKLFFDIHCHAMNLSHPNLVALLKRSPLQLLSLALPNIRSVYSLLGTHRALNLLSIMENEIGGIFLIIEFFLKKQGLVQNGKFSLEDKTYDAFVLTPLLMDFDYKNIKRSDIYYNIPPEKPIEEQTLDIFNGISKYCSHELVEKTPGNYETQERQNKPIFEIYPFLGINTCHYRLDEINEKLHTYFGEYSGSYEALKANFGAFNGDIKTLRSNFFAGIKVYPPMGFDPWPEADKDELKKVLLLYEYCCAKNIPLTSHCSEIGFNLDENAEMYTAPKKWRKVLKEYPKLKLNLAHFGEQKNFLFMFKNHQWQDEIITLIEENENVYTDISYRAFNDGYYKCLKKIIGKNSKLLEHVLFGSDFMINLLCIDSYDDYLRYFKTTKHLTYEKDFFGSTNPWRFLFG